ncbi:MAG: CDP-diacylglycerol--serine O-phosphatidyltransferase [Acidobacteriota bacterium]|nr:CDP-diacylglycerol--serine O-phosphatidyltransferase [Blastocatellia bacterium]MDW8413155.1 CDP-diacylglycerol--serine O-phosphatidyltransferase [Acidobacteriota bacterium]
MNSFGYRVLNRRKPDLRKGVYVVPSLFTTANIFCGFYSVIESFKGFQSLGLNDVLAATAHFDVSAQCIGWAVLFDLLDGRIARMTKATTEFGVELDSIADVLSFGIAPAALAFAWGANPAPQMQKLAWAVSFMFLVCGALRLARFNVLSRKPQEPALKRYFVGMPIPAGASVIAAIVHFTPVPLSKREVSLRIFGYHFDSMLYSFALLILLAVLALLMISTIRYNNFKGSGEPQRRSHTKTVLLIAILMFAIYSWSQVTLLLMAVAYASMGPLARLIGMFRPGRPLTHEVTEVELNR